MKIVPIILCGGSGTRLWPLSRENHPKQFVDLGGGRTLFKDTLARLKAIPNAAEPVAVCNEAHRFLAAESLREMGMDCRLILEPVPRNTAPAIALAACSLDENSLMLVLPADHYIGDNAILASAIARASVLAGSGYDKIVAFGITPASPETGYGYIRAGKPLEDAFAIAEFVEKPDRQTAERMLANGGYLWNAGIFLMSPQTYLRELRKFAPKIADCAVSAMARASNENGFIRPKAEILLDCPEDSIDYAVMEKTGCSAVMPVNTPWSDLGSWEEFFRQTDKDQANNAIQGDVLIEDAHDCYFHSNGRLLTAVGVSNLMVVETRDAVIVAQRQESQRIKDVVKKLKENGRYHYKHHPLVYKPWGSYETLALGDRFQVKRLVVNPGESLSLQYHHHRAEHWIVVSGTAQITMDGVEKLLTENQSVYIPIGSRHRLHNPGKIPLVLIEVQSGGYLEEDDIVRVDDKYGRAEGKPEQMQARIGPAVRDIGE